MLWIYLVIFAQLINAAVVLVDKFLVTHKRAIPDPLVYAFYVSILSGVVVILWPLGLVEPATYRVILLSLGTGFSFLASLIFLYKSLRVSDASDIAPALGAISAVFTLFFSFFLLGAIPTGNFLLGFVFLVGGTALMSYFRFTKKSTLLIIIAGLFFGLSSVFVKMVFNETAFISGFFWSRMANVFAAVVLLSYPANARRILANIKSSSVGIKFTVVLNKFFAGAAFVLILFAIHLGDVSIVNALIGAQFVFLLIFALAFTKKFPEYFYETTHRPSIILQKVVSILLIIVGFAFLFI